MDQAVQSGRIGCLKSIVFVILLSEQVTCSAVILVKVVGFTILSYPVKQLSTLSTSKTSVYKDTRTVTIETVSAVCTAGISIPVFSGSCETRTSITASASSEILITTLLCCLVSMNTVIT